VGSRAVALIGPQEAGKSTTAAAFAKLDYPVLTDDVVALSSRGDMFMVPPGYPRLRLWPDSVSALYGTAHALPPLTPNWEKCYLDLTRDDCRFQSQPLPLGGLRIMRKRSDDPAAPFVQRVSPKSGIMSLIANSYVTYLKDKDMRAQEFDLLSKVASHVPLRWVIPHSNPTHLSKLCDVIRNDFFTFTS